MTERDALCAAVLAAPADDLPRLVFADWCDDHGEPDRAEFIRVQVELARMPADDPRRGPLADRAKQLLTPDNKSRWDIPEGGGLVQGYCRGFVESIYTTAERFLELADDLFRLAPVRELRLSVATNFVSELCWVGGLANVVALDLSGNMLGVNDRLERLLTDAPLDNLRKLTVRDNRLFADAVGQIARSPVGPRLTTLNLSGNPLSDDGMAALAATNRLSKLRTLIVRNDEQSYEDSIHDEGIVAFAKAALFGHLTRLDLTGHVCYDTGFISLLDSPVGRTLLELRLARNWIGEFDNSWAEELTRPDRGHVPRLIDLSGRRTTVGVPAAESLVRWPRLADGVTVDLRGCSFTGSGQAHTILAASPYSGSRLLIDPQPPEVSE